MGDVEQKTQNDVMELREQLTSMSTNIRLFSLSMRSLYVENAIGTSTEPAKEFRKLRDDTRNDAMVYLKGVLPLSAKFVASTSEYFAFYEALDYNEWCELLSVILDKTGDYRKLCETVVKMHEDILVPLKRRRDEAKSITTEFKDLQAEFEKKKKELEEKASTKRWWAIGLSIIPIIGWIASSVLKNCADSDLADAIAKGSQANAQEAAAFAVSETLIPALEAFMDGMRKAAGFFSVMELELSNFEGEAERCQEHELLNFEGKAEKFKNDRKYLYYKVMSKEAKYMRSVCQVFYAILPDIRTDFLAIPSEGTDQNYIDRWLEKHRKTIKDNFKGGLLANKLLELIESKAGE